MEVDLLIVEPTDAQYLILNALETLDLLQFRLYNENIGIWLIITASSVLPRAYLLPNGDIIPGE
ncbi:hypothetical protein [Chroogloeocystis siderophila]|uniref:Uncharacterized protein n=1 Tax=Chroogloeocystis siderophila 5.2 s.c.1 TaxID=247279 RepID=A0A1U7HER4_9CHRO|nr:hypothetical protein [Chroogloeocystis siderophila]OKH22092.1 hypothetical protein NIES1031_20660 [Chroogloeocystis siderophila 5.2 s.c.1]